MAAWEALVAFLDDASLAVAYNTSQLIICLIKRTIALRIRLVDVHSTYSTILC